MVPVLKICIGLPPYLGMLFALGLVWVVTEWAWEKPRAAGQGGVPAALHKVDLTGLLFFTGVLLAVVALDSAGVLSRYSAFLVDTFGDNAVVLCSLLGVSSAVVDNVPLV